MGFFKRNITCLSSMSLFIVSIQVDVGGYSANEYSSPEISFVAVSKIGIYSRTKPRKALKKNYKCQLPGNQPLTPREKYGYTFILVISLYLLQHIYLAYLSTVLAPLPHLNSLSHCREWLDLHLVAQVLKELLPESFRRPRY